jgi:hypothetical protein
MNQKEKSPLEQLIIWAETASKQSIIDKAHELMKIERMEVKSQRLVELMQVLEMIEHVLQNGDTITPDSFVIRTSVRLAIGMDVLNNEVDKSGLYCDFPCCKNVGTNKVEKTAVYYCDEHF